MWLSPPCKSEKISGCNRKGSSRWLLYALHVPPACGASQSMPYRKCTWQHTYMELDPWEMGKEGLSDQQHMPAPSPPPGGRADA